MSAETSRKLRELVRMWMLLGIAVVLAGLFMALVVLLPKWLGVTVVVVSFVSAMSWAIWSRDERC